MVASLKFVNEKDYWSYRTQFVGNVWSGQGLGIIHFVRPAYEKSCGCAATTGNQTQARTTIARQVTNSHVRYTNAKYSLTKSIKHSILAFSANPLSLLA